MSPLVFTRIVAHSSSLTVLPAIVYPRSSPSEGTYRVSLGCMRGDTLDIHHLIGLQSAVTLHRTGFHTRNEFESVDDVLLG